MRIPSYEIKIENESEDSWYSSSHYHVTFCCPNIVVTIFLIYLAKGKSSIPDLIGIYDSV
jgi:hypothetical protein